MKSLLRLFEAAQSVDAVIDASSKVISGELRGLKDKLTKAGVPVERQSSYFNKVIKSALDASPIKTNKDWSEIEQTAKGMYHRLQVQFPGDDVRDKLAIALRWKFPNRYSDDEAGVALATREASKIVNSIKASGETPGLLRQGQPNKPYSDDQKATAYRQALRMYKMSLNASQNKDYAKRIAAKLLMDRFPMLFSDPKSGRMNTQHKQEMMDMLNRIQHTAEREP